MCRKIHEDKAGIRCHPQHCTARRRKARLLRSMMRGDTATRLHSRTARTYHCRHHQTSQRDTAHPLGLWIPRDSTNRQHTCTAGTLLHPLHCNAQHHTTPLSRSWIQPGMSTQANTHPNNPSSTVRVQRQTVLPRTLYSYHPLVSTSQQRICSQGTSVPYCPRDTSTQPHMALLIPGARISGIRHTHIPHQSNSHMLCTPHTQSAPHRKIRNSRAAHSRHHVPTQLLLVWPPTLPYRPAAQRPLHELVRPTVAPNSPGPHSKHCPPL